jgi:hypothetical protein
VANDYKKYTCYGCHEHTPANIRREHVEEGIRNFDNCVECHRSGDKDEAKAGHSNYRAPQPYYPSRKKSWLNEIFD